MSPTTVTAVEALKLRTAATHSLLDMRSEGEFETAAIPGFISCPILHDDERHQVGLCYRQQGQSAAIALGHRLVDPTRDERVSQWLAYSPAGTPLLVACWRGGLRSQIATQWLADAGRPVARVVGGYKAMRQELLRVLATPPALCVLSGLTGSGKTRLLADLDPRVRKVDIEALAVHRGSSFGRLNRPQPTQTNFENSLALELAGSRWTDATAATVIVEDESKVVGSLHLPELFYRALVGSPLVILEESMANRCRNIYDEYVGELLKRGEDPSAVAAQLTANTRKLQKRLGGLLTAEILRALQTAFAAGEPEAHFPWITLLLTEYYDARYRHAQEQSGRPVAFRGNFEECRAWISDRYV